MSSSRATTMMELDPPAHTTYRRLVQPPFSYREVASYELGLRLMARAVIEDVKGQERFDFVDVLARHLPMRMLGRLLGVPDEDGPWLVRRGDALIGNADPELTDHPVDLADTEAYRLLPFRSPVSLELFAYADEQAKRRRAHPTDDVISLLLRPTRDGTPLSDEEFKNFFTLLVAAGNDTTRYTIAAGMQALLAHPEQLATLRDHPELTDSAVEEMLRWSSVTMHFRRTAVHDTQLGGQDVRAGDKVLIWYISGRLRRAAIPAPPRVRYPSHAERAPGVRPEESPQVPGRASGAPRDQGPVPGTAAGACRDSAGRRRRPPAIELHFRHQAPAGCRAMGVTTGDDRQGCGGIGCP